MSEARLELNGTIASFDEEKREVDVFVAPWDTDAETVRGVERIQRGAFDGIDPSRFIFRQRHQDPPTGRGISLEEKDDGLHMGFRISKTAAGDEQLTLIRDGVETGVSVGFEDGKYSRKRLSGGRMHYTHSRVNPDGQLEVSTTWKPAYRSAQVLQIREDQMTEETTPQDEAQDSAASSSEADEALIQRALNAFESHVHDRFEALQDRIAANGLKVPDAVSAAMERTVKINVREVAEVISSDNTGVLPIAINNELIGVIDSSRPFMEGTTRIPAPPGETLRYPVLTQRPLVGKQAAEKDELASRKTIIGTTDFPMETYGGVGDLSLQLIKRSSPEFLNLWIRLLGEAYAIETDNAALDDLLGTAAVVEGTGTFDPESPSFGESFANGAAAAAGRPALLPNRIFLSTAALVAFIDAKEPSGGGGRPLYPGLAQVSGIATGPESGPAGFSMRPVWVPAMDDESVDILIGPSRGFQWAEDGTYTLQADIPSKFGKDVGLAGMVWFAPVYPAAFTTYALAS